MGQAIVLARDPAGVADIGMNFNVSKDRRMKLISWGCFVLHLSGPKKRGQ